MAGVRASRVYRCGRCGAESVRALGFVQGGVRAPGSWLCRPCVALERDRRFPRSARRLAGTGLVAATLLVAVPAGESSLAWLRGLAALAINLALFPMLAAPLVILVHEAGHWLAARLLAFDVHAVQIGSGRRLARFEWAGVPVTWSENPSLGQIVCASRGRRLARTRLAIVLLAGPCTHLLWILLAMRINEALGLGFSGWTEGFRPAASLAAMNGGLLALNLLPLRFGTTWTDGARLLSLPFLGALEREALLAERWSVPARIAFGEGRAARAQALVEQGLSRHPGDFLLQAIDASLAIERGDHEGARQRLLLLRARPELSDEQRAMLANDLAWNLHVSGRPEDRADADALSLEAQHQLGEETAIQSTRGGVLVDLGRAEEAWLLLANALEKTREPRPRASILCDLARAEHLLGRPTVARGRLLEARASNPECALLPLTEAELAAPPRPAPPAEGAPAGAPAASLLSAPRAGRRALRWAVVAVPAGALLWNCAPPFVVGSLLGEVVWYDPPVGPATAGQQRECRAGLARLDQLESVAGVWPPLRALEDSYGLVARRAGLLECVGEVGGAREVLRGAIAAAEPGLDAGSVSARQLQGFQLQGYWRALADLEERAGERDAARAAFVGLRELGWTLDGGNVSEGFALDATAAFGRFLARAGDAEAARELYRSSLLEAERGGAEEWALVPLLQAYAELLDAEEGGEAATELYARIGRATGAAPLD